VLENGGGAWGCPRHTEEYFAGRFEVTPRPLCELGLAAEVGRQPNLAAALEDGGGAWGCPRHTEEYFADRFEVTPRTLGELGSAAEVGR